MLYLFNQSRGFIIVLQQMCMNLEAMEDAIADLFLFYMISDSLKSLFFFLFNTDPQNICPIM